MTEIWKDIKGFEGIYQISNFGNVKSLERTVYSKKTNKIVGYLEEKIMKPNEVFGGYYQISLHKDGIRIVKKIHRLVAEYFIPNLDNKREVNHKDRNVKNNHYSNLEWVTPKENMKHLEENFGFTFGRKEVAMYDNNGELIKIFNSLHEAAKYCGVNESKKGKYNSSNIRRAIITGGFAYGYKWRYVE